MYDFKNPEATVGQEVEEQPQELATDVDELDLSDIELEVLSEMTPLAELYAGDSATFQTSGCTGSCGC